MTDRINELESQLARASDRRQTIDILNSLVNELREFDPARALALAEQTIRLARSSASDSTGYDEQLADSCLQLGQTHLRTASYKTALSLLYEAVSHYAVINHQHGRALALNAAALTYLYLGAYPEALTRFLEVLDAARNTEDRHLEAMALNNIGYLHNLLGDHVRALDYLSECIEVAQREDHIALMADAYDNLGNAHYGLRQYQAAVRCGLRSVELCRATNTRRGEAEALHSLGEVYQADGDFRQALDYYQQALQVSMLIDHRHQQLGTLIKIGSLYREHGQMDKALIHLRRALSIAEEIDARRELFECHRELAEVYEQTGDYQQAVTHYKQHQTLKEEVFNIEADQRLKNLQVVHDVETAKHEADASHLKNVALQREIDERRQAERALRVSNQQLQQEIESREQLIDDLDAFAHTVAHDLKNPLTLIMGYSELLLQEPAIPDPGRSQYLQLINSTSRKLAGIIDEMLVLASLRYERMALVPIDMGKVICEVETRLAQVIAQSQAEIIKPEEWPEVLGYGPWLEEVWVNYMTNAIKYGGKPPCLELGATSQSGGRVRFWIHDNGDGISPEVHDRLFTAFTRVDRAHAPGHGLGLSIVKRIIEKLGGEVGVESEGIAGHGSTFSFTLAGTSNAPQAEQPA